MAHRPDHSSNAAAQGDGQVSTCISNLIQAFTNGLNIFKRLRERRRKRKSKKHRKKSQTSDSASSAELQLSNSLRQGPVDIKEKYDDCYGIVGKKFAKGDTIAHASLTETLVKLNTGLVGIINTFLNHGSKNSHLDLDYKSLTNLSDASRREALESLNQLCLRLSQSQLQLQLQHYRATACPNCGSSSHQVCSATEKKKRSSSRSRSNGPTITRIPGKGLSGTQLVVMRPKNPRKSSSGTSSPKSGKSSTPPSTTPYDSPLASPLPQYSPIDPMINLSHFPYQKHSHAPSKPHPSTGAGTRRSIDGPRPTTWPHTRPDAITPTRKPSPPTTSGRPAKLPQQPIPLPQKRRLDKATPSTYTFASDSTKLGEIPQRNWTIPWDQEEAERLNAEAALYVVNPAPAESKSRGRRGLFGFLRRGSVSAS